MRFARLLSVLVFSALALTPLTPVWAQNPPDQWHPYRGGVNCVQVADSLGNFNCAAGTTIDPATGNMVIIGTLTFTSLTPGTFVNGLALAPVGSTVQLLGSGDLAIATSPATVAASGPLFRGVTLRVRQGPAGACQLVVSGGNSFGQEFIIPVVPRSSFQIGGGYVNNATPPRPYSTLLTFPGGPAGC